MKPDLSIDFAGIKLKNPVLTASGTFGYGYELADLIPLEKLGAIVTKTVTIEPRPGNPQPRIAESPPACLIPSDSKILVSKLLLKNRKCAKRCLCYKSVMDLANDYVDAVNILSKVKV